MKNKNELLGQFVLGNEILLEDIPNIDLYMDQVIQLFENTYGQTKRFPTDKIMTKTMINNYAKGKVFFPIENKKYSKQHLILLSLIYQLKGALSINDIKTTLAGINNKIVNEQFDLESLYRSYLQLCTESNNSFKDDVEKEILNVEEKVSQLSTNEAVYLEQVLLISSLIHKSNLYRRMAEALIDEIQE